MNPAKLQELIVATRSKAYEQEDICGQVGAGTDTGYKAYQESMRLHGLANSLKRCQTPLEDALRALRNPGHREAFLLEFKAQTLEAISACMEKLQ